MTVVLIGFAVVVVAFIGMMVYSHYKTKHAKSLPDLPNVKNLTQNNFKQYTSGGLVFVSFWASWNGPSKQMTSLLNDIAKEQQDPLKIGRVNLDNQQAIGAKFKVRTLPTLIIFKNGKEIKRITGTKNKKALMEEISEFLGHA
jgi:thioredoxin 1